ncbi:hypothetical protein M758_UG109600 [Ceratodon purpureus]|nr:hypothetical protein M758_UG109600 [Ceratodon purpureus]
MGIAEGGRSAKSIVFQAAPHRQIPCLRKTRKPRNQLQKFMPVDVQTINRCPGIRKLTCKFQHMVYHDMRNRHLEAALLQFSKLRCPLQIRHGVKESESSEVCTRE